MGTQTLSLAGTGQKYTKVQARVYRMKRDGRRGLHIQGRGNPVNRGYGVAVTVEIDDELRGYLKQMPTPCSSLAGTENRYFTLQVRVRGDNLHFQVKDGEFNRQYGSSFDVPIANAPALAKFLGYTEDDDDDDCI